MLEWSAYVDHLLTSECGFDGLDLSFDNDNQTVGIPPIIKASVLMLDRMLERQGEFNILVFPERVQSIFIFTLVKLLHNIAEGRIERDYDPEKFSSGEHLRLGRAIVEFVCVTETPKGKGIKIKLSDMEYTAPFELFPLFQKTTNSKRLSKFDTFRAEKKAQEQMLQQLSAEEKIIKLLTDYKTHMDSSIVNMTSVISTKEQLNTCSLCGQRVKDLILVGHADYEGNVKNIGAGQLGGTPAVVLASDLYAIAQMAQNGHPIQSIIIDGSNANTLITQIDALDDLMRLGVPITCVTDVVNSFDLQPFLERNFSMWRWDKASITDSLYDVTALSSDKKIKHCAKQNLEYIVSDGKEISSAIRLLSRHRGDVQSMSAQMLKIFDRLYSMAFVVLRETVPFSEEQLSQYKHTLDECAVLLSEEKNFISEETYGDFRDVLESLKAVCSKQFVLPKHQALCEYLRTQKEKKICIVVPERTDKERVERYWQNWCRRAMLRTTIFVRYPGEYYQVQTSQFDSTVVIGWLKRAIMRKTLFSFNTQDYVVLLYDYEKRWKNYDSYRWKKALDLSHNREIIKSSFSTDQLNISTTRFEPTESIPVETPQTDEYAEIEMVLKENKYRHYIANGGTKPENETTEAIPVNYIGGYLAFYQLGHKLLSATKIIVEDSEKIETLCPEQLKLGEFIVVRETDHDLIREIADVMLKRAGKSHLRDLAGKWKTALMIESIFSSEEDIYHRLQQAGCKIGFPTFKGWMTDEDTIAPHSKQDLEFIAKATGDPVLTEKLDEIYDAAQNVRSAHIQAGRVLSAQLRNRVVEALQQYGDIDPFNIWEPIEMQMDGVGTVRILKIIDIGSPVRVDIADTNRLIDED